MEKSSREVAVNDLMPGMFVVSLDRPWLETPFLVQGFTLKEDQEIKTLKEYCDYVYVEEDSIPSSFQERIRHSVEKISVKNLDELLPQREKNRYKDTSTIKSEMPIAKSLQGEMQSRLNTLFKAIKAGKQFDVIQLKQSAHSMVDSVVRNPDAMIWLAQMKSVDNYTYRHAIGASVWAVSLGRQIGLPRHDLTTLAVGTLLADIGKAKISPQILNKPDTLTEAEFSEVKKHVRYSIELLRETPGVGEETIVVVANHHERHDGSGYPNKLNGDKIPIFSRIAAIADCYDAITSTRCHAKALSPSEAIKKLFEWRDKEFQGELIEEFIQAIGIYPAGSLVELSNGEVAVVIAEGRRQRLRPKVLMLLCADKKPIKKPLVVDLQNNLEDQAGNPLQIDKGLEPGAFGIDSDELYF